MATVVLDIEKLRESQPCLQDEVKYPDTALETAFNYAVALLGNTDTSSFAGYDPENGVTERETLLYLATCHIAYLLGDGNNTELGRLNSASQGNVSVSYSHDVFDSVSESWWNKTKCGTLFWMLTGKYRIGGRFYGIVHNHPWS